MEKSNYIHDYLVWYNNQNNEEYQYEFKVTDVSKADYIAKGVLKIEPNSFGKWNISLYHDEKSICLEHDIPNLKQAIMLFNNIKNYKK